MWQTTPDGRSLLQAQKSILLSDDLSQAPHTIEVDPAIQYQRMVGFGAAITGSSAWLINRGLSARQRDGLMNALFDPSSGIGLSFMRLTIGASDFSLQSYTYDDVQAGGSDFGLSEFSVQRERADLIPIARQAKSLNPRLEFMASPWSAPAWMKTSGSLSGGSLSEGSYGVYAQYLVKYLKAFAAEGLAMHAISVQNEPAHVAGYPTMSMSAAEQGTFIGQHLGPLFSQEGISTRILGFDHNWNTPEYPIALLGNAQASPYIAGSAFHCYAGDVSAQSLVRDAYPGKDIYFTECSGGDWATDFGANLAWNVKNLVIGAPRNWSKSVLLWNVALDPRGGPANGGCSNCRGVVTIDPSNGRVKYNVEYYALGHASKFVVPGAIRIASASSAATGLLSVAFLNPDGSRVLIVLNSASQSRTFKVRAGGQAFTSTLGAGAVATYKW